MALPVMAQEAVAEVAAVAQPQAAFPFRSACSGPE